MLNYQLSSCIQMYLNYLPLQDVQSELDILFPPPTPPPSEVKVTIIDPKDEEKQEKQEQTEGEKQDSEGENGTSN